MQTRWNFLLVQNAIFQMGFQNLRWESPLINNKKIAKYFPQETVKKVPSTKFSSKHENCDHKSYFIY